MHEHHLPHDHGYNSEEILTHLPKVEDFGTASHIFALLGDATRARIFWILCHCEECVINVSAMMNMSSPAVSHHLKLLRDASLIVSRREGKEVYYKAADTETARVLHDMIEKVLSITCPTK